MRHKARCMKTSSQHKERLFGFFFLCYFIVYATSPLTYTFPDNKLCESSLAADAAFSDTKKIEVFLWEVIMDNVAAREDRTHEPPSDTVIIMKKRALIPERASTLLSFDTALAPKNRHALPPLVLAFSGHTPPAVRGTGTGFFISYAGHAPPLG
jgi:hypothetical protein